ncbi:hypothetical protein B5T_02647 [Alloalcanivorax dieselolei B5]|uniref:Uncharacterized protein n=1 Tax=Alcanivorax dieselolei (strain DSM 16502 / CGMCC 1.3690 / MCCC 1A00001 / B-5) TaxID=930169 RepID=K0CGQ5_ALCDB|nr:hypothetical protein [Alloalcanivorax dieselolei]AFT70917.1 hypothetical protein B5T_02647 [Alloalcanivorax dieselolei B5]GGK01602.1 hypothetical protein GCM10007426_33330 [Alloalcanivorax dieselolei]
MPSLTVRQDGPLTLVELPDGIDVDPAVQWRIYRQRLALFHMHGERRQHVIYRGNIGSLDMRAARFACGNDFARITAHKVIVLESALNRTFAHMMLTLNKPAFTVSTALSLEQARTRLLSELPPDAGNSPLAASVKGR